MSKDPRIVQTERRALATFTIMSKELALTLGLLAVLAGWAQATEGHSIYGVKLCGREFIRAVIFTCGGSRWRRSVGTLGDSDDLPSAHDDETFDAWSSNSNLIPHRSYKPQVDLEQDGEGPDSSAFVRPARSLISDEVLEALRTSDRKGRDVVVGLSNACCKWGCSKSEISSLC
ncbi:relaxin-3b [Trichomycterus rosablanca]|uniref:relaxin-3b n=1 Tax=Trichomycterus rosablanca TaxID=2290929 RepID=UPI002F3563DB